jgi:hypothetical protein
MTDAREALRAAIAARAEAAAALEDTRVALRRAEAMAAEAEQALAPHVDFDDRVAAHRGRVVEIWARAGKSDAPKVELSPALAAEAVERDRRLAALEAARAGVAHLSRAAEAGRHDLMRADDAVFHAAEDVVLAYLSDLEARWSAAFAESQRLAVEMRAAASVWFSAAGITPRPITISRQHRSALQMLDAADVAGLTAKMANPGAHPFAGQIGNWHRRLMLDADAELDPAEPAKAA